MKTLKANRTDIDTATDFGGDSMKEYGCRRMCWDSTQPSGRAAARQDGNGLET